jgi:hypothetical protein
VHYWNTSDPFYAFNLEENLARKAYYGVSYVPSFRYDGRYIQDLFTPYEAFYQFFRWTLDSLVTVPSPVRINIDQYPSEDWDSVYVGLDVVAVDSIIDDTTPDLYLAVVEERHRYAYPVGRWDYSFRDIVPDGDGEVITIQKGDSLHFDWTYVVNSIFNLDAILTTVWVQNDPDTTVLDPEARSKVLQSASAKVVDVAGITAGDAPSAIWLGRSFPNPFATLTRIGYALGSAGKVRLSVYAPTGRLVARLVDGEAGPGSHAATWDGRDCLGNQVGSGMYYYKLEAEGVSRTGRMVLLR